MTETNYLLQNFPQPIFFVKFMNNSYGQIIKVPTNSNNGCMYVMYS